MNQIIQLALAGTFLGLLCCAAITDHKSNRLPDFLTIPVLFLGLLNNLNWNFVPLYESALGSAIGYSIIRFLHSMQVSRRGFAGIGLGDAKFLAALGAWFGWQSLPIILTGASVVTLAVYPRRRNKPFGVGLGITALILFVYHKYPIHYWKSKRNSYNNDSVLIVIIQKRFPYRLTMNIPSRRNGCLLSGTSFSRDHS